MFVIGLDEDGIIALHSPQIAHFISSEANLDVRSDPPVLLAQFFSGGTTIDPLVRG